MGVIWTEEQQKVISLRDRNILVSAAAGSGKTAVLVERILSKICDPKKPVDIDRLLIMTFTRAAAGEMKERISAAIDYDHRWFLCIYHPKLFSYDRSGSGISYSRRGRTETSA